MRYGSFYEREEKLLSCPRVFRHRCHPARLPLSSLAADAACRGRDGDPGRPQGGRSAKAGADITPATGRGRFAPMPHAARGGRGTAQLKRQILRSRTKGSTGEQGESVSFEKGNTLTAAGADVRAQTQGKTVLFPQCAGSVTSDQGAAAAPLTPCTAPGRRPAARAGQQPRCTEGHRFATTTGRFTFFKVKTL